MSKAKRYKISSKTGSSRPAGLKSMLGESLKTMKKKVKGLMGKPTTKAAVAKGHNYSPKHAASTLAKSKKKKKKMLEAAGKY